MVDRNEAADEHTVRGYVVTVVLEEEMEKEGVTIPRPGVEVPSFLGFFSD
jgi:hypothetical protein